MKEIARPTTARRSGARGMVVSIPFSAISLCGFGESVFLSESGSDLIASSFPIDLSIGSYAIIKGQIQIPAVWRKKMNIHPGDFIKKYLDQVDGAMVLRLQKAT